MKITDEFVFFWGEEFSNFFPSKFTVDGIVFSCNEQYFMYKKALHFGDQITAQKILMTDKPIKQKKLGRKVQGFDEVEWSHVRYDYMLDGLRAKFKDPKLAEVLKSTGERVIVEASPYDRIWGIGMSADDPRVENPSMWNGINLLGKCLMQVRSEI